MPNLVMLHSTAISFMICTFLPICHTRPDDVSVLIRVGSQSINSQFANCDMDNKPANVSDIPALKCFDCASKNGLIECTRHKCKTPEGCYILHEMDKDDCCPSCKGCYQNGKLYPSDTSWTDPNDPCEVYSCNTGVITKSRIFCYVPCQDPLPIFPGQCCPACPDCVVNGKPIEQETFVIIDKDPCVSCLCFAGRLVCSKKICPVLNCPLSKIIRIRDECCPRCLSIGKHINPPRGTCLLGDSIYDAGTEIALDPCTRCRCSNDNSTLHCERQNCPILQCRRELQEIPRGRCCAVCKIDRQSASLVRGDTKEIEHRRPVSVEEKFTNDGGKDREEGAERISFDIGKWSQDGLSEDANSQTYDEGVRIEASNKSKVHCKGECKWGSEVYKNGDSWDTKTCQTCKCTNGKISCVPIMCSAVVCPENMVLTVPKGQCCPRCIQKEGVCTVYGGSHFRTFDGKVYAFIGSCKYQLANDCDDDSFGVRMKNTVNGNDASLKRVTMKFGNVKVDLQSNKNTKVNDRIVDLPYNCRREKLNVAETNDTVTVASDFGVKVSWNYAGFLEVTVSDAYRRKVCGLCGNFNSVPDDDFITREGILVDDPATFAQSWSTDENCRDTRNYGTRGSNPKNDQRLCNYIKGPAFEKCNKKIVVNYYYDQCLNDMRECELDDLQCHCQSFTDYVRDCRKLGILMSGWRKAVGC